MVSKVIRIKNPTGLHLKPAGELCNEASKYKCRVMIDFKNSTFNAKSVLSILGACIKMGDEIVIKCDGIDEEKAMEAVCGVLGKGISE